MNDRPTFRPRIAQKPYRGNACVGQTPLQRFLAQHADVIACADALTRNGPVRADIALREIIAATGEDRLTITQVLYAAGQRICYDLVVPLSWWKKSGAERTHDLRNAWRL